MRRWLWLVLCLVLILLIAGGLYAWRVAADASIGAAAMAKIVCSCVFVDGRSLESCRADDPAGFEGIPVSVDRDTKSATGTLFVIVSRRATYHDGTGCALDPD